MGNCVSTDDTSPPPNTSHFSNSTRQNGDGKSPLLTCPLVEVEAVKQVFAENAPITRHPSPRVTRLRRNHQTRGQFMNAAPLLTGDLSSKTADENRHNLNGSEPFMALGKDRVSGEASEICSSTLSEGVSVSTSITEKRENYGYGNRKFHESRRISPKRTKHQSNSSEVKREKTVGKSPGRRSESSPDRVRPGPCSGARRDNGHNSRRRSRSPAIDSGPSKTGPAGSQSLRKTGRSPGRVRSRSGRIRTGDTGQESVENKCPQTSNELLENPLVSLECFIFL